MPILSFTLSPASLVKLHDVLVCLGKFSDTVSIEAHPGSLKLTSLNSTKSGYASFALDGIGFFSKYLFTPQAPTSRAAPSEGKFFCQIHNKALISVFNGRPSDVKGKDTAVERCEVTVREDAGQAECRFVIKMVCRQGVVRTYRLTYEPVQSQHALFDRNRVQNQWAIESRYLREITEYFGQRTDNLDIFPTHAENKVTFISYTDKIVNAGEVLKQPVHTSVSIEQNDFEDFVVQDGLHIGISVKDFRAIVAHAEICKASVTARYTTPGRPLQFSYEGEDMTCDFTLMTRSDSRGFTESRSATPQVSAASARPKPRQFVSQQQSSRANTAAPSRMRPPPAPSRKQNTAMTNEQTLTDPDAGAQARSEAMQVPPSTNMSNSLFFPPSPEERQWDEPSYAEEEDDMLGWDASADNDPMRIAAASQLRDDVPFPAMQNRSEEAAVANDFSEIEPTQRLSQIRGLFD